MIDLNFSREFFAAMLVTEVEKVGFAVLIRTFPDAMELQHPAVLIRGIREFAFDIAEGCFVRLGARCDGNRGPAVRNQQVRGRNPVHGGGLRVPGVRVSEKICGPGRQSFFDVKSVDGPAESICEGTASFQGGVWGGCQYRIFRDFQPLGLQFRPETYFCRK